MSERTDEELMARAADLEAGLAGRRSYRRFSSEAVSVDVVRSCVRIALSAPSGANQQPWTYVIVGSSDTKAEIRRRAEAVEQEFYRRRVTEAWKRELDPLGVDWEKPFLEEAPYLVCVFVQAYGIDEAGNHVKHYYPTESAAISVGFFIAAIHQVGLATVPYTPAPMGFLRDVLARPQNERPLFILPVGKPHPDYEPPPLLRRDTDRVVLERL